MKYLVILLLLAVSCAQPPPRDSDDPIGVAVESWESVDVGSLNEAIEKAIATGDTRLFSPLLVTLDLLGGDAGTHALSLRQEFNRSEEPDSVRVVLARDGFLDDSVRGDWHELILYQMPDGTWRVAQARRAVRCRRPDTGDYRSGPCQ
jgi:hypothetical protein